MSMRKKIVLNHVQKTNEFGNHAAKSLQIETKTDAATWNPVSKASVKADANTKQLYIEQFKILVNNIFFYFYFFQKYEHQ